MVVLAAFNVLLLRYSGQEDIIVGSPVTGRGPVETESLIGMFVNQLALRTDLSGNPSFRRLLANVRKVAVEAYAHQATHFEEVVEALNPQRDLSRAPVFQVRINLENIPGGSVEAKGLSFSELVSESEGAQHDLTLELSGGDAGLCCMWVYNADLFEESTIKRMVGHFRTLLEGIVAHPERRLSDLPLLSEDERHQLLVEWNDTERDYPREACVHELFE
jgi:non-ribosomal peptide synthetase component F